MNEAECFQIEVAKGPFWGEELHGFGSLILMIVILSSVYIVCI